MPPSADFIISPFKSVGDAKISPLPNSPSVTIQYIHHHRRKVNTMMQLNSKYAASGKGSGGFLFTLPLNFFYCFTFNIQPTTRHDTTP
jgi:hypothetical protein